MNQPLYGNTTNKNNILDPILINSNKIIGFIAWRMNRLSTLTDHVRLTPYYIGLVSNKDEPGYHESPNSLTN